MKRLRVQFPPHEGAIQKALIERMTKGPAQSAAGNVRGWEHRGALSSPWLKTLAETPVLGTWEASLLSLEQRVGLSLALPVFLNEGLNANAHYTS